MIQWLKNLFKKEEQKTPYDLERWKIRNENWYKLKRETELMELFYKIMSGPSLFPGQTQIPYQFIYYIDKCIEYGEPQKALDGIKQLEWFIQGTNINLDELKQKVYKTKEYKEYIINKKIKEIEQDFI